MNNYENLISFLELRQKYQSEKPDLIIRGIDSVVSPNNYENGETFGIQDATVKYGNGYITVSVTIPLSQKFIADINMKNKNSVLHDILSLGAYWDLNYGWAFSDNKSERILKNLKLYTFSLNYSPDLKTFVLNLELMPSNYLVLGDIKLSMCPNTIRRVKTAQGFLTGDEKKNINANIMNYNNSHTLSLGGIIESLLDECTYMLSDKERTARIKQVTTINNDIAKLKQGESELWFPITNEDMTMFRLAHGHKALMDELVAKGRESQIIKTYVYLSDVFMNASDFDIPDKNDIRLILIKGTASSANDQAIAFNQDVLSEKKVMTTLTDEEKNKNISVLSFIYTLLSENGYTMFQNSSATNRDGKLNWIILQTNFNNIAKSYDEYEWIGITSSKTKAISKDKSVNTIINKTNAQSIFDLHSNQNVVISMNASTDTGESTAGTALTDELIARDSISNNKIGVNIEKHRQDMLSYLAIQSKTIDFETIGLPEIDVCDNINIVLAGSVFSGKYKVIELEDKISDTYTTSFTAIRTVDGIGNDVLTTQDNVVDENDIISKKERIEKDNRAVFIGDY